MILTKKTPPWIHFHAAISTPVESLCVERASVFASVMSSSTPLTMPETALLSRIDTLAFSDRVTSLFALEGPAAALRQHQDCAVRLGDEPFRRNMSIARQRRLQTQGAVPESLSSSGPLG